MKSNAVITFAYSLIVAAGGVIGYITAGSFASLIMGLSFGTLLFISGWTMLQKSTLAHFSAVMLSAMLALFFMYRFAVTWKVMPAGMMAILSLLVIGYFLLPRRRLA